MDGTHELVPVKVRVWTSWYMIRDRGYWVVYVMGREELWMKGRFFRAVVDDFGQLVPIQEI